MGLTKISGDVIQTPLNVGVVTATRIDGDVNSTGVSTFSTLKVGASVNITSGIVTATTFSGNLTGNVTGNVNSSGVSTFNNVTVGGATTALIVNGNARITGILTVGTGSITINPNTDSITGVTTLGVTTAYVTSINDGPLSGARNIIINGSMVINQRGWTGAAGTTTSSYVTDRFYTSFSHDGAVSAGQTSMTSGNAFNDGFGNALFFNVITADASLAASQNQLIVQAIEGFNVQGIKKGTPNALPVTLSFWCRSTTTGTYIAELTDTDNTRRVSQAYTINAANTWEKKVLTFPADTIGALDNDNNVSLRVIWWLAAGSDYSSGTLSTTWHTTSENRAVGQTNLLASAGNNFWLTGVQLEVGSVATPFERRSYGQELVLCQRYYEKTFNQSTAPANGISSPDRLVGVVYDAINNTGFQASFKVSKRAAPNIITFYRGANQATNNAFGYYNGSSWASATMGGVVSNEYQFRIDISVSGRSFGQALILDGNWSADSEL